MIRFYLACEATGYYVLMHPPPPDMEDVLRVEGKEISRSKIRQTLTTLERSVVPEIFEEKFMWMVQHTLNHFQMNEFADILALNPPGRLERRGVCIDTFLSVAEESDISEWLPNATHQISELRKTMQLKKCTLDKIREERNAIHHSNISWKRQLYAYAKACLLYTSPSPRD